MRPEVTSSFAGFTTITRRTVLTLTAAALAGTALPAFAAPQAAPSTKMDADEAHEKAGSGEIILVDIRTPEEWAETEIAEGAIAIDMRDQENFVGALVALRKANPDTPIALICRTGNRSGYVVGALADQGFPDLVDVTEGMAGGRNGTGWLNRGLPTYPGTPEEIAARLEAVMPCTEAC